MKKILLPFLFTLIIMLQGCATEPIFYHSEASLPYFQHSTKTVFELIKDGNASSSFQFGVILAKDNDTLSYVLLAPTKEGKYANNLTDINLFCSIPLLPKQVKEFINILNTSSDKWNSKFDSKNGINYEFMVSPENQIILQSENVVAWYSTLKYYFQNNEDGPLGTLLFGEGKLNYFYKLNEISEIQKLINMLNIAIKNM